MKKHALIALRATLGLASTASAYNVSVTNETNCTCEQPDFDLVHCKIKNENASTVQPLDKDF